MAASADSAPVIAALRAAGCARILAISPTREVGRIIRAVGACATGVMITSGKVDLTGSAFGIELSALQIAGSERAPGADRSPRTAVVHATPEKGGAR